MNELKDLRGAGARTLETLRDAGITTVRGLLDELPRDYRDMTSPRALCALRAGENALVDVWIAGETRSRYGGRLSIVSTVVTDGRDVAEVVWYNQPYLKKQLTEGKRLLLYGRVDTWKGRPRLVCPVFGQERGIVPLYRNIPGIRPAALRSLIREALASVGAIEDELPAPVREKYGLLDRDTAVRTAHIPQDMAQLAQARRSLAFEELLLYQVCLMAQKDRGRQGAAIPADEEALKEIWRLFPFDPTGAQRRVLREIASDLASDRAMARLVQGDVGSGKTAVAISAVFVAVKSGYQAAFIAPTEVLAKQNYQAIKTYFKEAEVALLTGSAPQKEKKEIKAALQSGKINIIVGTHALITEDVEFYNLSLCVCDEQQRFGVAQRSALLNKGVTPDVLVMSATPIPRTLSLIFYGDLDVTTIRDKPKNRIPVHTNVVPEEKYGDMLGFIKKQFDAGYQAYFVCPKIEGDEAGELISVTELKDELSGKLSGYRIGLLHGKMKDKEKNAVMQDFKDKKYDAIVSTTVIEVGVDVPSATVMVIYNAERFGLSQLHQLRGRVGRSDVKSYCFLLSRKTQGESAERLKILENNADGFKISEYDYKLRGSGDFMGNRQSGKFMNDLGDLDYSTESIFLAKKISDETFESGGDISEIKRIAKEKYDKLKDISMN